MYCLSNTLRTLVYWDFSAMFAIFITLKCFKLVCLRYDKRIIRLTNQIKKISGINILNHCFDRQFLRVGCQGIGNPANYFKLIVVKYEATIEDHVELNCHCTSDSNNIGRVYDIYKSQTQLVHTSLRVFRLHIQSFISF